MRTFGSVLRQLCDQRGWPPAEVARRSGVSVKTVDAILKRNNESSPLIPKFARAFDLTTDDIYALMEAEDPTPVAAEPGADAPIGFITPQVDLTPAHRAIAHHDGDVYAALTTIGHLLQQLPDATRTVVVTLLMQWASDPATKGELIPAIDLLLRTSTPDARVAQHIGPATPPPSSNAPVNSPR